jgi:hydrogenase maturation protease
VTCLVVGYGSDLRRDDAVGRRVADALADQSLPDVDVLSLHQLAPEVAADLVGVDTVFFVDADIAASTVSFEQLSAAPAPAVTTHHVSPASLLQLASVLGQGPGAAFVVSVPAADMGIGTDLSPAASVGVEAAIDIVLRLCGFATREHLR